MMMLNAIAMMILLCVDNVRVTVLVCFEGEVT